MSHSEITDKLTQYNEFFSIEYAFNINITPLSPSQVTSFDAFTRAMPMPFKMASDIELLNQSSVNKGGSATEISTQVTDLLNLQSKKIDLLMDFILGQQDNADLRYNAIEFGGGGLSFESDMAFSLMQFLEIKVFMLEKHCAIFCFAQVIDVKPRNDETGNYEHKVVFHFMRESDRESLVRYSLKEQAKQLQSLAKQRRCQTN